MIEKDFYFLAGLPRSGSTVLSSVLNQNPSLYATPTSPLLDLLFLNEQEWHKNPSVIANPYPIQLASISEAIINGCWEHVPQNIIIDKHRAWGRNLSAIEAIFHKKPKVIITVRDVPSIIASFMSLLRKSSQKPHYIDQMLIDKGFWLNDLNRAAILWEHFIKDTWDSFRTAWNYDKTSLLLVNYDDLVTKKEESVSKVYDFLNITPYKHDFENIKNTSVDDDLQAWGLENLHMIYPKLEKVAKSPEEILGAAIFKKYSSMNLEFWK